jgi:hypothetical protein
MTYLSKYQNIKAYVVLDEDGSPELMPKFYLDQWPACYSEFAGDLSVDSVLKTVSRHGAPNPPAFFLFTGEKTLNSMVAKAKAQFPELVYETTVESGLIDRLVHWLNPVNKNRRIVIYRNAAVFPNPKP